MHKVVHIWISVSASQTVGRGFVSRPGHTKDHHKNGTNCLMARNALGLKFGSAAILSKRPGSVWNCLWGHALRINRKSKVFIPVPDFYLVQHGLRCRKSINQSINLLLRETKADQSN